MSMNKYGCTSIVPLPKYIVPSDSFKAVLLEAIKAGEIEMKNQWPAIAKELLEDEKNGRFANEQP